MVVEVRSMLNIGFYDLCELPDLSGCGGFFGCVSFTHFRQQAESEEGGHRPPAGSFVPI